MTPFPGRVKGSFSGKLLACHPHDVRGANGEKDIQARKEDDAGREMAIREARSGWTDAEAAEIRNVMHAMNNGAGLQTGGMRAGVTTSAVERCGGK